MIKSLIPLCLDVAQRIVKRPQISRVNLALTSKCNHKCVSCNIWKNNATARDLITVDDVDKLISSNHLLWVSLTGGEPTLNPYFRDILALSSSRLKLVNIITNGSYPILLESSVRKALKRAHLIVVHISLLGNEEYHGRITGIPESYNQVMESIQRLKSLKNGKLIIGLEHMLSFRNIGQANHVRELTRKLGVGLTYVEEQKAGYYNNLDSKIKGAPLPPMDFTANPVDLFKNTFLYRARKNTGIKCVAGKYSCTILPSKDVFPCLFAIPDNPAFNLYDTDYSLGDRMMHSEYVMNCKTRCYTPCESYTAFMFRPWRLIW
jgi:MoaA/NifB/PqqE/SkfB family radical SAM enzyme